MLVQASTTFALTLTVSRSGTGGITGLAPTVAVRRLSDGYYYDWNDSTFKASGWTTKAGALTDRSDGRYERTMTAPATGGTILIAEYACTDTGYQAIDTEAITVVATLHTIAGSVWDESESSHVSAGTTGYAQSICRKAVTNKAVQSTGSPGSLVIYEDDSTTAALTCALYDKDGGAVTGTTGVPARRNKGT